MQIPSFPAPATLRLRLLAGSALGLGLAGPAAAQTPPAGAIQLPGLSVETSRPSDPAQDYRTEQPALQKLTQPMRDTPQSITTVPRALIDDRGATTVNDALRSVPGISLGAGEAGAQGSNLTIRGFSARNDFFLDGMRDFGSYYRDPFDLERIEVLDGPASLLFGRGSTGGVVNQVSKSPQLTPSLAGSVGFGTDATRRVTADVNQPLPELGPGAALRLNVMGHDSGVAGRDVAENQRYGVAPTLALGLGTPTRLTLGYLHQSESDVPDYGLPWFPARGRVAGVERSNFYGFKDDHLKTGVDIGTARIEHDLTDAIRLSDQLRYANYTRDFRITEPQIGSGISPTTPLSAIAVTRNQIAGRSVETFLQNQADATAKFATGPFRHTASGGVEIGRETSAPIRYTYTGVPTTSLLSPNSDQPFAGTATLASNTNTTANTAGVYALDTIEIGHRWQLTGGLRWDRFAADYRQTTPTTRTAFHHVDQLPSYRAGIVYKPMEIGSVYFSYGTSFNPSAESLSLSASTASLTPEKSRVFEIGSKWDLLGERLSVHGAIFRDEKTNARVTSPTDPTQTILGGNQRVDGFSIELAGRVTEAWQAWAGYTYLDNKVIQSSTAAAVAPAGSELTNTPRNTVTLWTSYQTPWKLQIGGGGQYVDKRVARNTQVPQYVASGYFTLDAMAKYPITDHIDAQLNIYNITNEYYLDQLHPSHVVPGPGRSALLTISYKY